MTSVDDVPKPGLVGLTMGFSGNSSKAGSVVTTPQPGTADFIGLQEAPADSMASVRRIRLGCCLVDLATENAVRRVLEDRLACPPGTGTLLVASANLDHITHFGGRPEGDGLDPGRMDDWLVLLDGMPFVQGAFRLTGVNYPRVAGSDLLPELFDIAEASQHSVVILGGRPEIRQPLAAAMARRWPALRLGGHLTPTRAELTDPVSSLRLQAEIAALHPDLFVVCLGKPLQEQWMAQHARETGAKVVVGFGAAVDFIAGTVPRAPKWLRERGLEWTYRLVREPRRMAHRYLVQGPAALSKLRSDAASWPEVDRPGTASLPRGQLVHSSPQAASVPSPRRRPCTAVVVTYQSAGHIATLLEALQVERESGLDLDVVVVDNASTDGTADIVTGFGWAQLVRAGGNVGYAAGVNVGDRLTPSSRSLIVLNPDLVPTPGSLGRLLDALDDPEVGVVVPRIEDDDGTLSPSLRHEPSLGRAVVDALLGRHAARLPRRWSGMVWDPRAYETEQFPDWATGAALLVSAACRTAVGEWDERYFLYSEETDYLRRVRAAGLRIRYVPGAVVRHSGGGSGTSDSLHALYVVNSIRYYRRYHAWLSSAVFGVMTGVGELLRVRRPSSRLALRVLLSPAAKALLPRPSTGPLAFETVESHG
jgi:exopolysaccharide biosynthesis WecB/TagA/CpsF family protein